MTNPIALNQVSYIESGTVLLEDISLTVKPNEIMGLLGTNGAGKSTLLKICAGILLPSCGDLHYQETRLGDAIGYVPEVPPLLPRWTVRRFLTYACKQRGVPSVQEALERVTLDCELQRILNQTIGTLSKGNQQRVAIAQSLLHKPKLLLLDEPTAGLDPYQMSHFRSLIQRIKSQTTVIFSSHMMQEVIGLCDRVAMLHQGRLIELLDMHAQMRLSVIQFAHAVDDKLFANMPSWQQGREQLHIFEFSTQSEKDAFFEYCLAHDLAIDKVMDATQLLEQHFLREVDTDLSAVRA